MFPTCEACNDSTREEERIIAFFAQLAHPALSTLQQEEFERSLKAVYSRHPELIDAMKGTTANDVRRFLQRSNLKLPPGLSTADLHVVKLPSSIDKIVRKFSQRLGRALHYKHTRRIVPVDGVVRVNWFTNASLVTNKFPHPVFSRLTKQPKLERATVNLSEQFSYRYEVSVAGDLGMYGCAFGRSFYVVCIVVFDPEVAAEIELKVAAAKSLKAAEASAALATERVSAAP